MKTLIAIVVSFFNPSVDSVLSSFTKTVKRLEKLAARAEVRAVKAFDKITDITDAADRAVEKQRTIRRAAFLEQDRATAVASKLNDLFSAE